MNPSQPQAMDSLKLVRLDNVLKGFVEEAYENLQARLNEGEESNEEVQKNILLTLHEAKQKLFRLDIICQWGQKAKAAVQCKRVLDSCRQDGDALIAAADQLAYLHSELLYTRTPIFDVPLSFRILGEGNMNILPTRIWKDIMAQDIGSKRLAFHPYSWLHDDAVRDRMLFILKSKLMTENIQDQFRITFDRDNSSVILTSADSLYQATLCLVPSPTATSIVQKWKGMREQDEDDMMMDIVEEELMDDFSMWRWRTLSVRLLPDLEVSSSHVSSSTLEFVRQAIDERLWVTSDLQILQRLGLQEKLLPNADVATTIQSPLLEMEKVLRAVSSHVLVGVVVLEAARNLESGSWKGSIKVGKPADAQGIRIELWCGLPVLTPYEYEKMKVSDYLDEKVKESTHQAALEIQFDSSSSLLASVFPLMNEEDSSDIVVRGLCNSDRAGNDNLNEILLKIASRLAANHLQAIMSSLIRQVELHPSLGQYSSVFFRTNEKSAKQSPRLDIMTCNQGILSLLINLKTGYPVFMLGSSILEDGVVYDKAFAIMQSASSRLVADIKQSKVSSLPENTTRSMHFCAIVAKHTLGIWSELITLTSLGHFLKEDPFLNLSRCLHVPGVLQNSKKYIVCYKVESQRLLELPKGLAPRAKQQYMDHLIGFLSFETDLGHIGFQDAKFYMYEENELSVIMKERKVIISEPLWNRVLEEVLDKEKDLSGKKRSRSEVVLSCPDLHSELSNSMREELLQMEKFFLQEFAQESIMLQFEKLMIQAVTKSTDDPNVILFDVKLPKSFLNSQQGLVSGGISSIVTMQSDFQMSLLVMSLMDVEGLVSVMNKTTLQSSSPFRCVTNDTSIVIEYKNQSNISTKGVWGPLSDLYRILECQNLTSSLVANVYPNDIQDIAMPGEISLKILSRNLDSICFEIYTLKEQDMEFHCEAKICWADVVVDHTSWPDGDKSLICIPTVSLSAQVPMQISDQLNKQLEDALKVHPINGLKSFLSSLSQLSYIGHFLECSLLGSKVQSETPIKKGEVKITKIETQIPDESNVASVFIEFTCTQKRAIGCKCFVSVHGFKDFECHPLPDPAGSDLSFVWFDQAWDMWRMENGWDLQKRDSGVFVSSGNLHSLQKQLKELLFCCCGQR